MIKLNRIVEPLANWIHQFSCIQFSCVLICERGSYVGQMNFIQKLKLNALEFITEN